MFLLYLRNIHFNNPKKDRHDRASDTKKVYKQVVYR